MTLKEQELYEKILIEINKIVDSYEENHKSKGTYLMGLSKVAEVLKKKEE